jgi:hypothetical protein
MSPDPTKAPASTPSASTKTFLVPITKRAGIDAPVEVTDIAAALRQHGLYDVNFRQKSQEEVHVRLKDAQDYAIFRLHGTWGFIHVVTPGGQPVPAAPAAVAFAHFALLLKRIEARLEDRVEKPDPYALVRQITQEERDVCKRIGRPPDLRSKAAYLAVKPMLRLIKEEAK